MRGRSCCRLILLLMSETTADNGMDQSDSAHVAPDPATTAEMWDARYSADTRVWSGEPNGALVAEVATLQPGTVLDVGCGEGADAVWLAQQGWDVTALEVSGVALERAREAAAHAGVDITWIHAGLLEAQLREGGYDLVSAQYPALWRSPDAAAQRALMSAVAPGGRLLFVHHMIFGTQPDGSEPQPHGPNHDHGHGPDNEDKGHGHGYGESSGESDGGPESEAADNPGPVFSPEDFVGVSDMAEAIGTGWTVLTDEVRSRNLTSGAGAHHTEDRVLIAIRTNSQG